MSQPHLINLENVIVQFFVLLVWTWIDGADFRNQTSLTEENSVQYPGSRSGAAYWQDNNGNIWMFGGEGFDVSETINQADSELPFYPSNGAETYLLNTLWKFDIHKNSWSLVHHGGSEKDVPVARHYAAACGVTGELYLLYGGIGYKYETHSDLWLFDISMLKWERLSTTQSDKNVPEARGDVAYWCTQDALWLYGGLRSNFEVLSDFWKFSLKSKTWTKLSITIENSGRELVRSLNPRNGAMTWNVNDTDLYMFAGNSIQNYEHYRHLANGLSSDMWKFSTMSGNWTFLAGFTETKQPGNYGERGEINKKNNPGCREHGATWVDKDNNLWLFGGEGTATLPVGIYTQTDPLADLWKFDTSVRSWIFFGGSKSEEARAVYGSKLKPDPSNLPPPRCESLAWYYNDTVYLFGGIGHDNYEQDGWLNDLWAMVLIDIPPYTLMFTNKPRSAISPTKAFLMTLGILVVISVFFIFLVWGKKYCNLPRHKPSAKSPAGFDVKYSPLVDDTDFTIMSTSSKNNLDNNIPPI
ncbi:uncharacterized protein LOC144352634 [Saccoglossus kowalevskii]